MNKYKINTNREPLSKEDIDKQMNFDKFYSGLSVAKTSWWLASTKLYLSVSIALIAIATASYLYISNSRKNKTISEAFICPPLPELNLQSDQFLINNERDTTLIYKSGTSIHIPANIFKTKEGKDVNGPVEIRYNEFHDQVDQIFSGIPMNYDSAGVQYQFESAGMFDVMAYQDGKVLELKDNKELTVDMISYTDSNAYNVYYLDTIQKRWVYNDKNTKQNKKYLANLNGQNYTPDKTILSRPAFIAPRRANTELNNFLIDYDKEEFPELAVYDGVKFEVEKSEKNYDPELSQQVWEDISIRRYTDNTHYIITIKAGKKSKSFIASPVFDAKDFDIAFKAYEMKRLEHEKRIIKQTDSLNALENKFTLEARITNNNQNASFANSVQKGWVYRTIVVSKFGRWNSDYPIQLFAIEKFNGKVINKDQMINAHFLSAEDGKNLPASKAFLFNRTQNAIYPMSEKDFDKFPRNFSENADAIVLICSDKRIFYIEDDQLKGTANADNEIYFRMMEFKTLKINEERMRENNFKEIRDILKI